MAELLLILYMAITSRMAGGGLGAHLLNKKGERDDKGVDKGGISPMKLTFLPELLFALPFGLILADTLHHTSVLVILGMFILGSAWSYVWMQTGHKNALHWGNGRHDPSRINTLDPLVNLLIGKLGIKEYSINHARLFMAVKGFLIGLPVGGIPLAVLWPLGYEIGLKLKRHDVAELLAGAGAGIACVLFKLIF